MIKRFGVKIVVFFLSLLLYLLIFGVFSHDITSEEIAHSVYNHASDDSLQKVTDSYTKVCDEGAILQDESGKENEINCNSEEEFFVSIVSHKVNWEKNKETLKEKTGSLSEGDSLFAKFISGIGKFWKILTFSILGSVIVLFIVLFFLNFGDIKGFIGSTAEILMELGLWLTIPYLLIKLYFYLGGSIDTSTLVNSMFEKGFHNPLSIFFSLLLVIFTLKYTALIFTIGVILLIITAVLKFTKIIL